MPTLVLVRHGLSTWNLENRFTGWTDVPLAPQGEEEAREGGQLLRAAGFSFDQARTSVLRRSIQTLQLMLGELGQEWLPVVRDWRWNERHYGALQGLNKAETAATYGMEQVKLWRRAYATQPPALGEDDPTHPRHDRRYAALAPAQLPATESLQDTLVRLLPAWEQDITPAVQAGQRLIIAVHGNSIRAIVKHLEGISDADIVDLNIPTGIPLVYELDDAMRAVSHRYLGPPELVLQRLKTAIARAGSVDPNALNAAEIDAVQLSPVDLKFLGRS